MNSWSASDNNPEGDDIESQQNPEIGLSPSDWKDLVSRVSSEIQSNTGWDISKEMLTSTQDDLRAQYIYEELINHADYSEVREYLMREVLNTFESQVNEFMATSSNNLYPQKNLNIDVLEETLMEIAGTPSDRVTSDPESIKQLGSPEEMDIIAEALNALIASLPDDISGLNGFATEMLREAISYVSRVASMFAVPELRQWGGIDDSETNDDDDDGGIGVIMN